MPGPITPDVIQSAALQQALAQDQSGAQQAAVAPTPPKQSGVGIAPYLALLAGNGADALTTYKALQRPGVSETNQILPSGGAGIVATKAALTIPEMLAMHYMGNHGQSAGAKALGYILGGLGGGLAVHNSTEGK